MKQVVLSKNKLSLVVVMTALAGSALAACSSSAPTASSPNSVSSETAIAREAADHQSGMQHGGLDHGMDLGPADAEYDLRFVDAMTPHHQGAIDMAQAVKQKSKRPEMQKLADAIIKAQAREIAQMKQWRQAWYPKASADPVAWHGPMGHSMPMSQDQVKAMMMSMDLGAADTEFDLRFLNAMIPHHEGAIVMARDVLKKSKRPEIRQLAENILSSQQAEITQMKQWRQAWYRQ